MVQLIQVIANGSGSINLSNLSSSTTYPPSTVWMQTLSYASLAFSVLAAFGAVMGKQWLNSYKSAHVQGSLENRGLQRQMKWDGIELWRLQFVLGVFFVLLQISLLLFGLSLSANMWTKEMTISRVLICTTAFGIMFYLSTILISVSRPDSPYQTAGSDFVRAVCKKFLPIKSTLDPDSDAYVRSSAIRWILDASTNPEVVSTAAALVPLVQWSPNVDVSAAYKRLFDNFKACHDKSGLYVKAMAHFWTQSLKIDWHLIERPIHSDARKILIRDAFLAGRHAWHLLRDAKKEEDRRKHKADARTALRTMVVYGRSYRLSLPDDEDLIWNADLRWSHDGGIAPSHEEFDWLVDYLADNRSSTDYITEGDALLVLSAMYPLGGSTDRGSYFRALIPSMNTTRPFRVRHAALRATSEARKELASVSSGAMLQDVDAGVLDELSRALLTAALPSPIQTSHDGKPEAPFHMNRDHCYIRLVFALARNEEWHQRLSDHGHVDRCIALADFILERPLWDLSFYLAGTLLRIDPSGIGLPLNPRQERWRALMHKAWVSLGGAGDPEIHDCIDVLPAIVEATRESSQGSEKGPLSLEPNDMQTLVKHVRHVLVCLQAAVGQECGSQVESALTAVQGLYDDLCRMSSGSGAEKW